MATGETGKAKTKQYVSALEGRCWAQGRALVQIANLCREDGGHLAQQILAIAGEILEPKHGA